MRFGPAYQNDAHKQVLLRKQFCALRATSRSILWNALLPSRQAIGRYFPGLFP